MERLFIICVDDQSETLSAVSKDLEGFVPHCEVEACESAAEALTLIDEIDAQGDFLAVVISDQVMPGMTGVDFLTELEQDRRFSDTRKILLTGQATHRDTVAAINKARIDHYIEKPWSPEQLEQAVKAQLTTFVFRRGLDHLPYTPILDQKMMLDELHRRGG